MQYKEDPRNLPKIQKRDFFNTISLQHSFAVFGRTLLVVG